MSCYDPMPNDLLQILVNSGYGYIEATREYQTPGGPERLRQLAWDYVQAIATANRPSQEGSPLRAAASP